MKNLSYTPNSDIKANYFQRRNEAVRVMTGTAHEGRWVESADKDYCRFNGGSSLYGRDTHQENMWGATMRTKDK